MTGEIIYQKWRAEAAGVSYHFEHDKFFGLRVYNPISKPPFLSRREMANALAYGNVPNLEYLTNRGPMTSSHCINEFGYTSFSIAKGGTVSSFAQVTLDRQLWTATRTFFRTDKDGQPIISLKEIKRAYSGMLESFLHVARCDLKVESRLLTNLKAMGFAGCYVEDEEGRLSKTPLPSGFEVDVSCQFTEGTPAEIDQIVSNFTEVFRDPEHWDDNF